MYIYTSYVFLARPDDLEAGRTEGMGEGGGGGTSMREEEEEAPGSPKIPQASAQETPGGSRRPQDNDKHCEEV